MLGSTSTVATTSPLAYRKRRSISFLLRRHRCNGDIVEFRSVALSTEQLFEAAVAVGLVVLLLEGALVQLLQAESADEVLRVKLAEHRGYAAT